MRQLRAQLRRLLRADDAQRQRIVQYRWLLQQLVRGAL